MSSAKLLGILWDRNGYDSGIEFYQIGGGRGLRVIIRPDGQGDAEIEIDGEQIDMLRSIINRLPSGKDGE